MPYVKSLSRLLLFIALNSTSSLWSQTCIELPVMNGNPQSAVAPGNWTIWNSTPDIIIGNGVYPGTSNATITNVNGTSLSGGEMVFFLINLALGANTEGIRTELTGLTVGNSYVVAVEWQQVTLDYNNVVNDPSGGRLGIYLDGVNLATFTSTGGVDDLWQIAYVTFNATSTHHTLGLKGELLNSWNHGAIVIDNLPCGIPLPIQLVNFEVTALNKTVQLSWSTHSELNNDYFTIQRSADLLKWNDIGTVKGAGNSSSILQYSFIDSITLRTSAYYRLKQTDFDGQSTHSDIRWVNWEIDSPDPLYIYPNPAADLVTVSGNSLDDLSMFDLSGRPIEISSLITYKSKNKIVMDVTPLTAGSYLIQSSEGSKILLIE